MTRRCRHWGYAGLTPPGAPPRWARRDPVEKMVRKKIFGGQERCNITNTAPLEKFSHYGRNGNSGNAQQRSAMSCWHCFCYGVTTQEITRRACFPTPQAGDADALLRYDIPPG